MAVSCGNGKESPGSITGEEFLDQLMDYQHLKENPDPEGSFVFGSISLECHQFHEIYFFFNFQQMFKRHRYFD
jgi:hypothetical protein